MVWVSLFSADWMGPSPRRNVHPVTQWLHFCLWLCVRPICQWNVPQHISQIRHYLWLYSKLWASSKNICNISKDPLVFPPPPAVQNNTPTEWWERRRSYVYITYTGSGKYRLYVSVQTTLLTERGTGCEWVCVCGRECKVIKASNTERWPNIDSPAALIRWNNRSLTVEK